MNEENIIEERLVGIEEQLQRLISMLFESLEPQDSEDEEH